MTRNRERGGATLEFPLAGIPLIMLLMITFEICLAMWSYHTLALAVKEGAIYASTKGQDCTYTGNNCQVSVATVVQRVLTAGVGINPNQLSVTLCTSTSGCLAACNPASNCLSNATLWPGSVPPNTGWIEIDASYPAPMSIPALLWPGKSLASMGTIEFSASSRQVVQY
jgi:Flp pilus assembly protein TadG